MERSCFVVMPFESKFNDLYEIIKRAAEKQHVSAQRADEVHRAGFVMDQILDRIKSADVVVAVLTDRNANVFYETAIAHMVKHPHQVILLAEKDDDVPFDLRPRRYLRYDNTAGGGHRLEQALVKFIGEALSGASGRLSETIVGREERTRRLVADCDAMLRMGDESLNSLLIRFSGGLSSLSISPEERQAPEFQAYGDLLQQERIKTETLIQKGATFRGIFAPRVTINALDPERFVQWMSRRFERVISLMQGDSRDLPLERLDIALSEPYYVHNVVVLGTKVLYDGFKATMKGGFDLSIRLTDNDHIAARVRAFDSLFDAARDYTLRTYGQRNQTDLHSATLRGLKKLYSEFLKRFSK